MAKLIRRSEITEHVHYLLCFDVYEPGGGFAFPCDAAGGVDEENLNSDARANLARCRAGDEFRYGDGTVGRAGKPYVQTFRSRSKRPAVYECEACGAELECDAFTNTCGCGADYNWAGQRLAPREQWGEETGEHWVDVAAIR